MEELTQKQKDVLRMIQSWTEENGFPPSVRDVASFFDVSVTAAAQHLQALVRKNVIHREPGKGRALTVSEAWQPKSGKEEKTPSLRQIPLLTGKIAAGYAQEIDSEATDYIEISQDLIGRGDFVAVKVHGLSMAGDFISDGDTAIIKIQKEYNGKDIFAVRTASGEVTLKRVRRKKDLCELVPSNPEFKVKEIPANQIEVLGKLVTIFRRF